MGERQTRAERFTVRSVRTRGSKNTTTRVRRGSGIGGMRVGQTKQGRRREGGRSSCVKVARQKRREPWGAGVRDGRNLETPSTQGRKAGATAAAGWEVAHGDIEREEGGKERASGNERTDAGARSSRARGEAGEVKENGEGRATKPVHREVAWGEGEEHGSGSGGGGRDAEKPAKCGHIGSRPSTTGFGRAEKVSRDRRGERRRADMKG